MKVIIIEDEPYARQELKRLLKKVDPAIEVVKELDEIEESVNWLSANTDFDLAFLDIQLSDGLSFEIFNRIPFNKPVIFTTAYNEYALNAFELNSIDYLLKPVEEKALQKAFDKLASMRSQLSTEKPFQLPPELMKLLDTGKKGFKNRFLSRVGDQFKYTQADEVAFFIAEHNTVTLVGQNGSKSIVNATLEELEGMVDPQEFFRANRSFIVNIKAVQKVHKYFNSRLLLELSPKTDEQVLVSRLKVDDFLNWLDQ